MHNINLYIMKQKLLLFGLAISALLFISFIGKGDSSNQKVVICHIPPGNPDNAHEIEVSVNAVDAHLAHGDNLGPCSCNCSDEPDQRSK